MFAEETTPRFSLAVRSLVAAAATWMVFVFLPICITPFYVETHAAGPSETTQWLQRLALGIPWPLLCAYMGIRNRARRSIALKWLLAAFPLALAFAIACRALLLPSESQSASAFLFDALGSFSLLTYLATSVSAVEAERRIKGIREVEQQRPLPARTRQRRQTRFVIAWVVVASTAVGAFATGIQSTDWNEPASSRVSLSPPSENSSSTDSTAGTEVSDAQRTESAQIENDHRDNQRALDVVITMLAATVFVTGLAGFVSRSMRRDRSTNPPNVRVHFVGLWLCVATSAAALALYNW